MTMMKHLFGATTALALLFAGPAGAQTAPAPAPTAAAAAATVDADPALWVIKRGNATVYLFGTVHVLKPGLSWFDEEVKAAFDRSDRLILELPDVDEKASQPLVLKLATDTSGVPLTKKLPEADRVAYEKAMAGLGIPAAAFDQFEPWFAAINLGLIPLLKLGYDPSSGAEKTLLAAAKQEHKPVAGLESLEQQLGYFDSMPEKLQIKYLAETVKDLPKAGENIDKMVAEWAKGDPDALAKTLNEGLDAQPELAKLLLADRNKRWAVVIDDMLSRPGTTFIAVGAGHLAGKDSVQNQLKRYGVTATRVAY